MNLLSTGFPQAQMMVCGVLGPQSHAHGPNEFLHVPYARRLTAAAAQVIARMPPAVSLQGGVRTGLKRPRVESPPAAAPSAPAAPVP